MSSDNQALSPEEKLLKVIQQTKAEKPAAAEPAPVPSPRVEKAAPAPASPPRKPAPEPEPARATTLVAQRKPEPAAEPPKPPVVEARNSSPPEPASKLKLAAKEKEPEHPAKSAPPPSPAPEAVTATAVAPDAEPGVAASAPAARSRAMPLGALGAELLESVMAGFGGRGISPVVLVNRSLTVIILVLVGSLIYYYAAPGQGGLEWSASAALVEDVAPGVVADPGGGLLPEAQYAELFAKDGRSMFQQRSAVPDPKKGKGADSAEGGFEALKNVKKLGISWDPKDEAASEVIVRDDKQRIAYYKAGQAIGDTGITVKKIQRDRVIVESAGKETELR